MTTNDFKPGDRVRVNDGFIRQWHGATGTIERIEKALYLVKPDDPSIFEGMPFKPCNPGFITTFSRYLVPLVDEVVKPKFEVGDTVEVLCTNLKLNGKVGTVTRLEDLVGVQLDGHRELWFDYDELKKLEHGKLGELQAMSKHERDMQELNSGGLKLGDTVHVSDPSSSFCGDVGTVIEKTTDGQMAKVRIKNYEPMWFHVARLQKVDPDQQELNSGGLSVGDRVELLETGDTGVVHSISSAPVDYPVNVILDGDFQETTAFKHSELMLLSEKADESFDGEIPDVATYNGDYLADVEALSKVLETSHDPDRVTVKSNLLRMLLQERDWLRANTEDPRDDADKLQTLAQEILAGDDSRAMLVHRCDDEDFDTVLFISKEDTGADADLVYQVAKAMQERSARR